MNSSIKIGEINTLRVNRDSDYGLFLVADDGEEILLPNAYIKKEHSLGKDIDVFVYTDSEDRLVATTINPKVRVDEFAYLKVIDITSFGAFLDMGLPKDLFIPRNRQKSEFKVGDYILVRVIEDTDTRRLIAIEKYFEYILPYKNRDSLNKEVDILVFAKTPLGYKSIINNTYEGMLFKNEIFQPLSIGDKLKAYIKNVRDDGKVDLILQKIGTKHGNTNINTVLDILTNSESARVITSKSSPELINQTFKMSKKAYKATLVQLIKLNKIIVEQNRVKLN